MSWLDNIQVLDLDEKPLEAMCRQCGETWYVTQVELLARQDMRADDYLSAVSKKLICRRRGCNVTNPRLALLKDEETSGFVGGLP